MLAALLLQVLSRKSCGSEGGAKNDQSLAFRRRAPRPYPNIATLLGLDGGEIGGAPLPQRSRRGSCPG